MNEVLFKIFFSIPDKIRRLFYYKLQNYIAHIYLRNKGVIYDRDNIKFNGMPILEISKDSVCRIGSGFICTSSPHIGIDVIRSKIYVKSQAKLYIGNYSGMTSTVILCTNQITIGSYVNIGGGCMIMDSNFHSLNWEDRENRKVDIERAKSKSVTIEDYVFIGARCVICKGVTIGARSIIAAGSVVVCDIPADCIAGGNPCKVIKRLH